ncbi:Uncharacterized protein TCM_013904 [Theobroma cacao]|uniref:Uncharacterized protein n=1 Tax=Theobroma cacao TaxID=3641 RepID=A0A061G439_THECC|nr:Uncharacterized protein TCM_013904 [Theobroma cacao]
MKVVEAWDDRYRDILFRHHLFAWKETILKDWLSKLEDMIITQDRIDRLIWIKGGLSIKRFVSTMDSSLNEGSRKLSLTLTWWPEREVHSNLTSGDTSSNISPRRSHKRGHGLIEKSLMRLIGDYEFRHTLSEANSFADELDIFGVERQEMFFA